MKKKCLLLFKWPIPAQKFLIHKFSKFYEIEYLYISDFTNHTFTEVIDEVNKFNKLKRIEIVFFDVDFIKMMNFFFIKQSKNVKKILWTQDDLVLHEMNSITANACDLVATGCPISVLKYQEKGYEAFYVPNESYGGIFKNYSLKKEIDVLFFGKISHDRKEFLDFLSNNGISLKIVGENNNFVTDEELSKLISKSKIVLNFSKTTGNSVINYISEDIYKYYYQFKGRVIHCGFLGTLCISEYSPGQEIMFNKDDIPTFHTKEECLKILNKFLKDKKLLSEATTKYCLKVSNLCEDKKNFEPVYKAIEDKNLRRVKLLQFPYWYLRISAKQAIKRNIKLTRFIKTIFQFNEIFKIIENSSFLTKFLIIFETIINIFWYSFTASFKKRE